MAYTEGAEEGWRAYIEPFTIVLILVLNACVEIFQDSDAERALEALKEMQTSTAKVLRDGAVRGACAVLLLRAVLPGAPPERLPPISMQRFLPGSWWSGT